MFFNDRDTIIRLTPEWQGERLPDGRPKVSQDILRRMRDITFEEAWAPLWDRGYRNNWECDFKTTSPGTDGGDGSQTPGSRSGADGYRHKGGRPPGFF